MVRSICSNRDAVIEDLFDSAGTAVAGPPRLVPLRAVGPGLLERTTSWSPKSKCVYGPENEIAAVTFFAKNGAALTKSNTFASVTEWQDSGEHGC